MDNANSKIIKEVVVKCSTCLKFKRPMPRPAVAFSKADDFNQTISVDLHHLAKNIWYLHMTDEFARYSAGAIITSKTAAPTVFMKHWIAILVAPRKIFSDNGG